VTGTTGLSGGDNGAFGPIGDAGARDGHVLDEAAAATGDEQGASLDATTSSNDDSAAPDPSDAPFPDAGGGGSSGGSGGNTDAGRGLLFKDDFEGAQALPRAWDEEEKLNGSIALDKALFLSPSTSLEASSLTITGGLVDALLHKRFPLPASGLTAAYELNAYIEKFDTRNNADAVIAAMQIADPGGDLYEMQIDVRLTPSNTMAVIFAEYTGFADGGSAYAAHPTANDLKLGTWNKIRIELTRAQPPVARVYFDGVLQVQTVVNVTVPGPTLQLSLGLSFVRPPSDPWAVAYDDVRYEVH
jgi:hypothetical protein